MNVIRRPAILLFISTFCACSLIADPDEFTYHEGSASDDETDNGEGDTDSESDRETDTTSGSTDDTASDTDSDTPSTDNDVCESNDDCDNGDVCPMFFTNDLFTESESYCYTSCREDARICDGTDNPLCYKYETGATCLARATIRGTFACRVVASTNTSEIDIRVRPDADAIRLTRCEIFQDETGFGFVFSTVSEGTVVEASFYFPDHPLDDLQTGTLENASGQIRRDVLDGNMSPTESTVLALFPLPDIEQNPTLVRDVDILNIQTALIQGVIEFDGFAYDAELMI